MGDSITEGSIAEWVKEEGDYVEVDDVVVVIETDKVAVDVRADVAGTVKKRHADVDDIVEVGQPLIDITPGDPPEGYQRSSVSVEDTPAESTLQTPTQTTTTSAQVATTSYANRFEAMKHKPHRTPLIKFTHGKREVSVTTTSSDAPIEEHVFAFDEPVVLGSPLYGRPFLSPAEVEAINTGDSNAMIA